MKFGKRQTVWSSSHVKRNEVNGNENEMQINWYVNDLEAENAYDMSMASTYGVLSSVRIILSYICN